MKNNTYLIRRLDDLGRVVIPRDLRKTLGLHEGDFMEISIREIDGKRGIAAIPYSPLGGESRAYRILRDVAAKIPDKCTLAILGNSSICAAIGRLSSNGKIVESNLAGFDWEHVYRMVKDNNTPLFDTDVSAYPIVNDGELVAVLAAWPEHFELLSDEASLVLKNTANIISLML